MVDEFNYESIKNGTYEFDTMKYFVNGDIVRAVIIIFIIISFIVNILYFISSFKIKFRGAKKEDAENFRANLILMGSLLFINFIHSFSYLYEWVLQNVDGKDSLYMNNDGNVCNTDVNKKNCKDEPDYYEIGGLLIGNMENLATCRTQAFFLIFSSLSQDIIINIYFYLVNKQSNVSYKIKIRLLIFLGYVFPIVLAAGYLAFGGLGINDKFCSIKKFNFENKIYSSYTGYMPLIFLFQLIRVINLIISAILLYKLGKYISRNKLGKRYMFKSYPFLIIQIITILIGFIYRLGDLLNKTFARKFVNAFLIFNTMDCVIFPLVSYFSNNMYRVFCKKKDEGVIDLLVEDNDVTSADVTRAPGKNLDKTGDANLKDNKNNFSISYM